jgi:prepilin-type N-terminal cleavage/methylation domain-containing protein
MKKNSFKGFTLIEVMISVALFSIIILFLYQTIDMNEKSNRFYEEKLTTYKNQDDVKFIIYEDILNNSLNIETNGTKTIQKDKNDNTILHLHTSNTFHNPFYNNVTYFLGKDGELFRVESKEYFNSENVYEVLKNSYIDIVFSDVEKFRVVKKEKENKFAVYIKLQNEDKIFLTISNPR